MRFLFACGGTAGHINPALGVAGRIKELLPSSEILFIGAEGKMEMDLVPLEGYEIRGVPVSNLSRSLSPEGETSSSEIGRGISAVADLVGQPCPVCGKGHLVKGKTAFGCSEYRSGCHTVLPFTEYPADLTPAKLSSLVKKNFKQTKK